MSDTRWWLEGHVNEPLLTRVVERRDGPPCPILPPDKDGWISRHAIGVRDAHDWVEAMTRMRPYRVPGKKVKKAKKVTQGTLL